MQCRAISMKKIEGGVRSSLWAIQYSIIQYTVRILGCCLCSKVVEGEVRADGTPMRGVMEACNDRSDGWYWMDGEQQKAKMHSQQGSSKSAMRRNGNVLCRMSCYA